MIMAATIFQQKLQQQQQQQNQQNKQTDTITKFSRLYSVM